MFPFIFVIIIVLYFGLLLGIAWYTSLKSDNESFFIGNRSSKWWLVAFGMVGTSLSGITFISVPGTVGKSGLEYFQVVIGYTIGYFVVAFVLLPIYYKYQVTSIYTYLERRLGNAAYKTGAVFFIISRTLGATLRLYLVINVLQNFIFSGFGITFESATLIILILILLYTYNGGVKTIVWTDTLQTTFMLLALVICVGYILTNLHLGIFDAWTAMKQQNFTHVFNTQASSPNFFLKQILGGAFITIAMTGLDQEMMQKNISVTTLKDAQKNMITLSFLQMFVVLVFLFLGGLLYLYAISRGGIFHDVINNNQTSLAFILNGKDITGDKIFPSIAAYYLPSFVGIIFIIGLISALFPSADGALTALTSSFCIDILGIMKPNQPVLNSIKTEKGKLHIRHIVHYSFAVLFLICIFIFRAIDKGSIIQMLLTIAGYTYGPLLALFTFGIFTNRNIDNVFVPLSCIVAPLLCYLLKENETKVLNGYHIGIEMLLLNAGISFILLWLFSKNTIKEKQ